MIFTKEYILLKMMICNAQIFECGIFQYTTDIMFVQNIFHFVVLQ